MVQKYARQIFSAFAANIGAFNFGTAWSWTATALPSMQNDPDFIPISEYTESWITCILFLGCIFSSPFSGYCIDKFGRRATMLMANLPCLIAWAMIGCSQNVELIYIGRFLTGICTACYGSAAPLYVAETSHSKIRGRLVCSFDTMIAAGMVFINIVGSFTSWRVQAFVCGLIPIIGHICMYLAPESPRFSLEKGNVDEARDSLKWLQPAESEKEIESEINQISESCIKDQSDKEKFGWKVVLEPSVFKPILIGCMLMFFHQFSGNYPILAYGVDVFSSTNSGNPYLGITAINGAQFLASILPLIFVDKWGRRPLLIISELAMAICLASFGFYFYFQTFKLSTDLQWLPITALILYEICYALGIGPIPWLLMGELVSPKLAGPSLGIITGFYRVLGFLQLFYFHDLTIVLGQDGIYYFFAISCLIGAFACYSFVPDTTGKTLDEIHDDGRSKREDTIQITNIFVVNKS